MKYDKHIFICVNERPDSVQKVIVVELGVMKFECALLN